MFNLGIGFQRLISWTFWSSEMLRSVSGKYLLMILKSVILSSSGSAVLE